MGIMHTTVDSPIGELTLVAEDGALRGVYFPGHWTRPDPAMFGERSERGFERIQQQLDEYFAGQRSTFELPTSPTGDTFQRQVWELIDRIPYSSNFRFLLEEKARLRILRLAKLLKNQVFNHPRF